jgi:hypothetical protein
VIIATGARLIMEYPQLRAANEVSQVLLALEQAVTSTWHLTGVSAHEQLTSWAKLIRTRFDTDNLSVTSRCDEFPVLEPLVYRLTQMQSKIDAVSSVCAHMETMLQTLLSENAQIRSENAQIRSDYILMRTLTIPLSVWNRCRRTTLLCLYKTSNSVILQPPSVLLQQVSYVNSSDY